LSGGTPAYWSVHFIDHRRSNELLGHSQGSNQRNAAEVYLGDTSHFPAEFPLDWDVARSFYLDSAGVIPRLT